MRKTGKQQETARQTSGPAKYQHVARNASRVKVVGAFALAGASLGAAAQTKALAVPDAQVESSVLQALAKNNTLAGQQITSTTTYGVVTLSGHVPDEPTRSLAEDVVARTAGVIKVVDELTLGASTATSAPESQSAVTAGPPLPDVAPQGSGTVLQSDGTYAPAGAVAAAEAGTPGSAPIERSNNEQAAAPGQPAPDQGQYQGQPAYDQGQYGSPSTQGGAGGPGYGQGGAPQNGAYGQPPYPQQNSNAGGAYGSSSGYPNPGQYGVPEGQGQQAGVQVTVPAGAVLQLRVNQPIDSRHSAVGSVFTGLLQQDVVIGGYVALPRGAAVQGTVVDASSAGALKGRAELGLQLSQVTLGGQMYPLASNLWSQASGDKAVRTVNSALGLGVLGAIVGGVAGGGPGAAIGAGVGGAAGLGASAASGGGAVIVPPESTLTFRLAQPLQVATVSQAELNRLAYNAPGAGPARMVRRYPGYYPYGPGYYPRYYRPYPY